MDKTDQLIIQILREDARRSNTEIAQKLNLSESAVRRRIANLVLGGIIKKFTIEVDDPQLTSAVTWIAVSPSVPTSQVSGKIRGVAGVETVYETAGQFDIAVVIKGANIVEVNKSVEGIRRVDGVINTNTMMILRTIR
ncbi:MAG: Lrp/AsnC family transcriptional regulator [Thaumarchaeota archaeon]|nr:Lrp/AsnC family transcriptional regulator [Nitrososphaerota archaeon]